MSERITDEQLEHIEQAASAADQGVAWHVQNGAKRGESIIAAQGNNAHGVFTARIIAERIFDQPTATYLATMDPGVTRQLVARVRELEAQVEHARRLHQAQNWYCAGCYGFDHGERVEWPCDTIKALGDQR